MAYKPQAEYRVPLSKTQQRKYESNFNEIQENERKVTAYLKSQNLKRGDISFGDALDLAEEAGL